MALKYLFMFVLALTLLACDSDEEERRPSADTSSDTSTPADAVDVEGQGDIDAPDPNEVEGISLMGRLVGLWSGPVTGTVLGSFPIMNMDIRPTDEGRQIFGRSDVDGENNLRFGFLIETHDGKDVLVYRNGGYFMGAMRDSRTILVEHDPFENHWRFCALPGGCDYIDASITFSADDRLVFDVQVRGAAHMNWSARRVEEHAVRPPFPTSTESRGTGEAPWPQMPALDIETTWPEALEEETWVWVLLTLNGCDLRGCDFSRAIGVAAPAGATRATLALEQLHPGSYEIIAFIDDNGNRQADRGERISFPNQHIDVAPEGRSATNVAINFRVP